MKLFPYWWDDAPVPRLPAAELPEAVEVAVVGAGYTGLSAALQTARAGRDTAVFEAEAIGFGCSSRNGGQISTSIKPDLKSLSRRHGAERGRAIHREGQAALDWIGDFIATEGIDCDFRLAGRFHAAHSPRAFRRLVEDAPELRRSGIPVEIVPPSEQRRELGSDAYHGGAVYPAHAALHPAKYHNGLLGRVRGAGARILDHCPVLAIDRTAAGFRLATGSGTVAAREVIVATNGYTGPLVPWLRRRIVPIGSYIIATEPIEPARMDRLFPTDRVVSDTRRVIYYYRPSPDRSRVLFGGRVSADETDPRKSAPLLRAEMCRLFPELAGVGISHSWTGTVAYSFDQMAHSGVHAGIHYALGYCGSGVSMASYLGMRIGRRVVGAADGRTAFDDLAFPTRPLYSGRPWFLPAVVAWYRWLDEREFDPARPFLAGDGRTRPAA